MAIYHLSTKPISRSSGRTATASIAYRAGVEIKDDRTGKTHDYTRRGGVLGTQLHTPNNIPISRAELWNLAETTETRKNSRTAREIVVNLPHELPPADRSALVNDFAKGLADKYGVAVDVALHSPDKEGDNRNYHAHIMLTTRKLERLESGRIALTDKAQLEMSNTQLKDKGLPSAKDELKAIRKQWADMTNERLERAEIDARIDHRSHADRGLKQLPTKKLGWEATALERKGIRTETGDYNRAVKAFNQTINHIENIDQDIEQKEREIRLLEKIQAHKERLKAQEAPKPTPQPEPEPQPEQTAEPQQPQETEKTTADDIEQKRQLVDQFIRNCKQRAEDFHKYKLEQLREKAKPLFKEIEQIRDSKPLNPFKVKAWQKNLDEKLEQYNKIKNLHDEMKATGVTEDDRNAVYAKIYQDNPEGYHKIERFSKEVSEYDAQQAELERQQRLAELEQRRLERQERQAERGNDRGMER